MKNKLGFLWVTLALFVISLSAHWIFAWFSYLEEQKEHNQPVAISNYFNITFRDTMENWQSEFLQLIWQVAGLSFLWYIGSPQSKEGDERKEEKMDLIIKMLDPKNARIILKELETKYPKK
ncbi:MAG TPA: DUF6766 family protein [Nitrososphaeraceae archaeon]|nr:DUF6766 family protein [Nitrososphaeraceae archaeon]